jgi:hypothetical protein
MGNPFHNQPGTSVDNRRSPFTDEITSDPVTVKAVPPLKPSQNVPEGMILNEDGSILIGTPELDKLTRGKRQIMVNIIKSNPVGNITIFYGSGAENGGDLFVKEMLTDDYVGSSVIDYGMNVLEIGNDYGLRSKIIQMETMKRDHNYYKLFNNTTKFNANIIRDILFEYAVGLIVYRLNFNERFEPLSATIGMEYIEILETCSFEDYIIPMLAVIEAAQLSDGLVDLADVVVYVDFLDAEDGRFLFICEKPGEHLFEPFYLYQDGTFVYKSDSLDPEVMDALGKKVIHPEE